MRKAVFNYILLLSSWLFFGSQGQAQNQYITYKLVSEADDQALTISKGTLTFEAEKQGASQYNQLFLLRRVGNGAKILLCPASDPTRFLKREGGAVILANLAEGADQSPFEWELNFAGIPFGTLSSPENPRMAFGRSADGNVLDEVPMLADNDASEGRSFRLRLKTVTNTL